MALRFAPGYIQPSYNPTTSVSTYKYNLYTAGYNPYGGTGQNTTYGPSNLFAKIGSAFWTAGAVARSGTFSLAVRENGTLWSWGRNEVGQLGLGNTTYYSSPKQIGALTTWRSVFAGYKSSYAIKTDGTLWSWGDNAQSQLGLGNTTQYSSPKQVGALTDWLTLAGGSYFVIATKTDGTLWAWGQNSSGQIGNGNTSNVSTPYQIGALTTWASVGASNAASHAVKTNGTLWSWGNNYYGNLGLGTSGAYAYRSSPSQVGALTIWSKATGAASTMFATTTTGQLFSCGENTYGKLGLGNTTAYSSPKQVAGANWATPIGGDQMGMCLKTNGELWFWGDNNYGQAGVGYGLYGGSERYVPIRSGTLTWGVVSLGNSTTLLLG